MLSFKVCNVENDEKRWIKARADLHDDLLIVRDRRQAPLFTVDAPQEKVSDTVYRYGDYTVTHLPGACGCGGLRTINK
jgi:hypothetical protein